MRLPVVPILLAVATRPVDVGARADPSDIVTTDGGIEVQRHLRVQERKPDKDNEERTFPSIEEIVSPNAVDKAADMLDLLVLDSDLGGASHNAMSNVNTRKRSADETLESMSKKFKAEFTLEEEILADMVWTRSQNMQMNGGEGPKKTFNEIMSKCTNSAWPETLEGINTLLLQSHSSPQEVFQLYQLNLAGDTLFQKPQLVYWIKYLIAYDKKMLTEESLFNTLSRYYNAKSLVVAIARAQPNNLAAQVGNQLKDFWFKTQVTPDGAFILLNLKEGKETDILFPFWMNYFVYYSERVKSDDKVLVESVGVILTQPSLLILFGQMMKSEITTQLEKDVKEIQLKIWENEKTSDDIVHQTVRADRSEWTVYGSALRVAVYEHFHRNQ